MTRTRTVVDEAPDTGSQPTVVVSHLDIVFRVVGGARPEPEDDDETDDATLVRRALRAGRSVGTVREVHAVKDVSFVAHHGERVGVIGRNGSGKSTLLKAVAGLIPASAGEVWTSGSPALLGVQAALVKSLSGRRNIYLGCLAMGMSSAQVDARFDEIVDVAGIGDAIDRPMSTYSSGMGARLRFAISTAARPDVLIIDEALATGDAAFKERSRQRIDEITSDAGTVFLVSHSAASIRAMCTRALWMDAGQLVADGPVEEVLGAYEEATGGTRRAQGGTPELDGITQIGTRSISTASARTSAFAGQSGLPVLFLSSRFDAGGALASAPNAALLGGPVLLSSNKQLPPAAAVEIARADPARVELLGGRATILPEVGAELEENGTVVVERPERNRVAQVAAMSAQSVREGAGGAVVLCDHEDRNIAAAALRALHLRAPLLLLRPSDSRLPTATIREIQRIRPELVDVYSDTDAPEDGLVETIRDLGVARVVRSQVDPVDSALAASREHFPGGRQDVLVCSASAVDELVAALWVPWSGSAPLLLVPDDGVPPEVADEIRRLGVERVSVLAVDARLPDPVLVELSGLVSGS
ncbi:ATP-binding cassette domain-containing protein [Janibacter melonis]|uniref:ABC transporter ATP-binding protein n=1 Tax=Janibacter melonis TaxID=262209 RepID=UPI00178060D7|nr:ABC transporter ATP-binding protein [Janibacter melonis]